jgi:acyl-CoA synthetase (NDP forming)
VQALLDGGFRGHIYPINPQAGEIAGLKAFPSVAALPEPVDLALIAVPRDAVLAVAQQCADRGVPALVVISAGFAEAGPEGRELQGRLAALVRDRGMRLIGPNCLGLLSTDPAVQLNATFIPAVVPGGRVAMASDSGALGLAILADAARLGLGVSACVSVGNRADVAAPDLLEYWEQDEATGVVVLYLESLDEPRRFADAAGRVSRRKPVVVLKAGRTPVGARAASSHTAALATSAAAEDALFRQSGVIRADTLAELFDLVAALDGQPLPAGRRVGVLTNAGGPAVLCADACATGGLSLPELSEGTRRQLAAFLPPAAALANPVDLIASATPADFGRAAAVLLGSGEVDSLIVLCVLPGVFSAEAVGEAVRDSVAAARRAGRADLPVLLCLMPEQKLHWVPVAATERLPCYAVPEAPARVLSKLAGHAEWLARLTGPSPYFADLDVLSARQVCRDALDERGPGWLTVEETSRVLRSCGLPLCPGGVARTAEEAVALAQRFGFPVAVKLASHTLVHKTEVGGVRLGLTDANQVRRAYGAIVAGLAAGHALRAMDGVLVQPMIGGGTEVLIGATRDPLFGPLLAFGMGGVQAEVLEDVCFRLAPLTADDAAEMVRSVRVHRLLRGYRGEPPADVAAVEETLLRVSRLIEAIPEMAELDLNPIVALPSGEGCSILDARLRVVRAPAV